MESLHRKWFSMALLLSLLIVFPMVLGQDTAEADLVGVKVGDWVKYNVISMGPSTIWGDLYDEAVWIKVEVQNVSATNVTVRETRHLQDGRDRVKTISWDLQGVGSWYHFIIATNLGPGDKVGDYTVWVNETGQFKDVDLTLNDTVSRSYGGVTREVNVLKFSELGTYFGWWRNNTLEYYWDCETGFLLEKIDLTFVVSCQNVQGFTFVIEGCNIEKEM